MNMSRIRWGLAALAIAALAGCGGGGGDAATPTPTPTPDIPVAVPTGTSQVILTANTPPAAFAALQFKLNVGRVTIAGSPVVDFSMTDLDGNAIVGFGSTTKSATATLSNYPNLSFALAKLVPGANGSPSKWVSYIVSTVPTTTSPTSVPTGPSTDNVGTLVDHKNGTYTYTFSTFRDVTKIKDFVAAAAASQAALATPKLVADLGDLTYDANLTHRLVVIVSGNAPGTGTNTPNAVQVVPGVPMANPANVVYDFIPATGKAVTATDTQRLIVDKASCNECHGKLGGIPGTETATFHGGARFDPQVCSICHTDQRKFGATNLASVANVFPLKNGAPQSASLADGVSVGDLPILVHKVHMGTELVKKNYNFGGVLFNETKYPQDIRNCTKCHDNSATASHPTAQGNNWKVAPSQMACGACHDGLNFKTATGVTLADAAAGLTSSTNPHPLAGPQADDSKCTQCHDATTIPVSHLPVTPPAANALTVAGGNNNTAAAFIAGNLKSLPAGAIVVAYELKSVDVDAATGQPSMTFRMLQNGAPVAFNDSAAKPEIWDNFVGSPSAYFVFAVPQDGIAKPADFNGSVSGYLRNIWNGTATGAGAGTLTALTGANAGYYKVTLTGVKIPANATMVTGGLGFTYGLTSTQPLTQINLPAYPVAANTLGFRATPAGTGPLLLTGGLIVAVQDAAKPATGYTARRTIVADGKCDKCHEQLGVFTAESFHAGQRNDGTSCAWCHNPNRTSSAWSADAAYFVHAIHAAGKRTTPFTWHAAKVGESFDNVGFPGVLSNCEACHVAGSYDFSGSANAAAVPNRLYRTVANGKFATGVGGTFTTYSAPATNCVTTATSAAQTDLGAFSLSPYIGSNVNYDVAFAFNANLTAASASCDAVGAVVPALAAGGTRQAGPASLVISPITTACFACHDSAQAMAHMQDNGGQIYAARGTSGTFGAPGTGALGALGTGNGEACLVCHGTGKEFDIKAVHPAVTQ
jgi:OmcA/MtrC family decaheme c-type cytochrome